MNAIDGVAVTIAIPSLALLASFVFVTKIRVFANLMPFGNKRRTASESFIFQVEVLFFIISTGRLSPQGKGIRDTFRRNPSRNL